MNRGMWKEREAATENERNQREIKNVYMMPEQMQIGGVERIEAPSQGEPTRTKSRKIDTRIWKRE